AGGADLVHEDRDTLVVRGEEALLLVAEVLVERLARHARPAHDVRHGGSRVALGRDGLYNGVEHALPLGGLHHLAAQAVGSAGELARGRAPGPVIWAGHGQASGIFTTERAHRTSLSVSGRPRSLRLPRNPPP